jgi:hypothetical protein
LPTEHNDYDQKDQTDSKLTPKDRITARPAFHTLNEVHATDDGREHDADELANE